MSRQTKNSGFTVEGHAPFPSLYADNQKVGQFTEWTTDALINRIAVYERFIMSSELPCHQSIAGRIIDHAAYELSFRFGDINE